jgi:3-isopropylmalate/(R)-2-methylmalate dehydratase small subunit
LPIKLNQEKVDFLLKEAENKKMLTINLEDQIIIDENENIIKFEIDSFRKKCLLEGLDDIALTLKKINKIDTFEKDLNASYPWIVQINV